MKIIWTFTLLMIPGVLSSISVTGYSGGGVSITCRYDRGYTVNAKYFCRGQWSECTDLIKTDTKNGEKWVDSGRFSLYDDTRAAVFTVTIRDLSEEDSGMYQCAADISWAKDFYSEVNLNVLTGQKISAVTGYSGGNVIINYKYETLEENPLIDVCKTGADQCLTLINTNRAAEWTHVGRFSIHDDRSARLLRVFIRQLNVNDSGEYKIVVKVSEDYSFFSEIHLDIRDGQKPVTPQIGWCSDLIKTEEKNEWVDSGRFSLFDNTRAAVFTVTIRDLSEEDSGTHQCGVDIRISEDFYTEVNLNIITGE
ncbi:polymeric immunoglobulin receptor-like [Sinocyclocheilus rhinocerous]|uniref:polymeric immunoglobulin receptor-like n=1 Tax=Sinocyclocheilus rhinocerous TaxID=307959 RepID=UPI0007B963CC|nr:PREDICTED: polymeric immunoglobulin receptor-like [Sinocyclocheilus rhinocerous]